MDMNWFRRKKITETNTQNTTAQQPNSIWRRTISDDAQAHEMQQYGRLFSVRFRHLNIVTTFSPLEIRHITISTNSAQYDAINKYEELLRNEIKRALREVEIDTTKSFGRWAHATQPKEERVKRWIWKKDESEKVKTCGIPRIEYNHCMKRKSSAVTNIWYSYNFFSYWSRVINCKTFPYILHLYTTIVRTVQIIVRLV